MISTFDDKSVRTAANNRDKRNKDISGSDPLFCRPVILLIILSLIYTFFIELVSRHSFISALKFSVLRPAAFICNCAIVMVLLSISLLFRKRRFALLFISVPILLLGIANGVLLGFRNTPLAAVDISVIPSVLTMIDVYLSVPQMILIAAALAAVVAFLVLSAVRSGKYPPRPRLAVSTILISAAVLAACLSGSILSGLISNDYTNLSSAYSRNGFLYSFSVSLFDRGISRPADYEQSAVDKILTEIGENDPLPAAEDEEFTPNIIFLQLESFFEPSYIKNLEISEEPIPCFTRLKEEYPSGFLTVPYMGSGTANTEFEIMTGMSLDFFGIGEYPYKTVLQDNTCESICYNLSELGYTSHAIHNNTGTFYDRWEVFPNLGYNSFTSLEYMQDVEFNDLGWAKDSVLTAEILKALDSTPGQDFIYAISVQGHGNYPSSDIRDEYEIAVSGDFSEEDLAAMRYYVNEIREMDTFLKDLIAALKKNGAPTLLVVYGDHLPALSISEEDLGGCGLFQTEYAIWSNFYLEAADRDLCTYQLSAYVMSLLGYDNGVLTKLHQSAADGEDYSAALEMLECDMLYGEHNVYGGIEALEPTEMAMGTVAVRVESVSEREDAVCVLGENFTPWTRIYVNDEELDTRFVDSSTLLTDKLTLSPGDTVYAAQVSEVGIILSRSEPFIIG
ncbi:MAG: LTA synthase family protein [Oscillospiraceae bacterium]|nr:LTA synthase family protein [Oscillospiraceae bacterium]